MTFALGEQTLTNITQGFRNHLTWEKEPAHPPARRETSPQEANSKETYPKAQGNNTATRSYLKYVTFGIDDAKCMQFQNPDAHILMAKIPMFAEFAGLTPFGG